MPRTQRSVAVIGYTDARLDRAIERFYRQLSRQTGATITRRNAEPSKATLVIRRCYIALAQA